MDAHALAGDGRQVAQLVELRLVAAEVAAGALVLGQRLLVGVDDEQALVAVHDDQGPVGNVGGEGAEADHGGDLQHAGHDGRVTGAAAGLGGEGVDALRVERRRLAGRQVVGQRHHRLAQMPQLLAALAEQAADDTSFQVGNVGDAAGQVSGLDAFQRLGEAAQDAVDGVLGGERPFADEAVHVALEGGVGEHEGVGAEDGAVLDAELGVDGLLRLAGFAGGVLERRWKRPTSASTWSASTKRWGMRNHSVSSTKAGPMATPGETAIPRLMSMSDARRSSALRFDRSAATPRDAERAPLARRG